MKVVPCMPYFTGVCLKYQKVILLSTDIFSPIPLSCGEFCQWKLHTITETDNIVTGRHSFTLTFSIFDIHLPTRLTIITMYGTYNQKYRVKGRFDTESCIYGSLHSRTPRWQTVFRRLVLYVLCFIGFLIIASFLKPQSGSYQWIVQEELAASEALIELEASLVKGIFPFLSFFLSI